MRKIFLFLSVWGAVLASAQTNLYTFDIRHDQHRLRSGHISMGTALSPAGARFDLNNHYLIRNGQPWFPIMGEIHYARIPKQKWDESLLKMKANGIDIIATYVFWNHHEEEEGRFDWSDGRDLKAFVEACARHGLYVWLRIGPWCHGEARNGGFPDWLLRKTNVRGNHPLFMQHVGRLFGEIGEQVNLQLFKNGGPIIGCQIENEFNFKSQTGLDYMLALKGMAVGAGIDVPYYSVTSWPGTNPGQRDFLLMYGAYPDAPWSKGTRQLPPRPDYLFRKLANDASIGADLTGTSKIEANDLFPYLSAELGGGNQVTYHRRPFIDSLDCVALAYAMMGSGANGLGYYMFSGGVNPRGKLTTLEENKHTNYPNDYSLIDYDFQSPMGQAGQLRRSYHHMKLLHYFANDFGKELAVTYPFFPDSMPDGVDDGQTLRCAMRAGNGSGYVFVSQFQRYGQMQDVPNVRFCVQTKNGTEVFPHRPVTVKANTQAIFPFHMPMGDAVLKYATAQPVCIINGKIPTYVFTAVDGIMPELAFVASTVRRIKGTVWQPEGDNTLLLSDIRPDTDCLYEVTDSKGKAFHVMVLKRSQALSAIKANVSGREHLIIGNADMVATDQEIKLLRKGEASFDVSVYPAVGRKLFNQHGGAIKYGRNGVFGRIQIDYPLLAAELAIDSVAGQNTPSLASDPAFNRLMDQIEKPLAGALPIWCPEAADTCWFRTQFTIPMGASAKAYLAFVADDEATVELNGNRIAIGGKNNNVVTLPLSNGLQATHNRLDIMVKNTHASAGLLARVFIVLPNSILCVPSNTGWLCKADPKAGTQWKNAVESDFLKGKEPLPWFSEQPGALYGESFVAWPGMKTLDVSTRFPYKADYVNDIFVETTYRADALAIYNDGRLMNDEFWNGRPWMFSLGRIVPSYNAKLRFQFTPQMPASRFFVEEPYRKSLDEANGFKVDSIRLVPEYKAVLRVK
ncbi:MAG: beta-galactosidase [Breznakibacter sp.]